MNVAPNMPPISDVDDVDPTPTPSPESLYPPVGPLTQKLGSLEISGTFSGARAVVEAVPTVRDLGTDTGSRVADAINRFRRQKKASQIETLPTKIDAVEEAVKVLPEAAKINNKKRAPRAAYNPLKDWDTHMKPRPVRQIHHDKTALSGREDKVNATNSLQEMGQQRMERRHQRISWLGDQMEKFTELYGEELFDSAKVEQRLKEGRFTRGEKKSIRQAGKFVRKYKKESVKIERKLDKVASGNNLGTRVHRARANHYRNKIERNEAKIPKLERKAEERDTKRKQRAVNRQERRQIQYGSRRSAQINRELVRSSDPEVRKTIYDQARHTPAN